MNDRSNAYLRLFAIALGTACVLACAGYFPTRYLAGPDGIVAMSAGIMVSLFAGCLGALPLVAVVRSSPSSAPQAIMLSTVVRLFVAMLLAVVGLLAHWPARAPFVVWVGLSYIVLLAADTIYVVRLMRHGHDSPALSSL